MLFLSILIALKYTGILEADINDKTERIKVYTINGSKYIKLKALPILFPINYKIKQASGRIIITGFAGKKIELLEGTNIVKNKSNTTLDADVVVLNNEYFIPLELIDIEQFKEILPDDLLYLTNLDELRIRMITKPIFSRPLISNKDELGIITFNYKSGLFEPNITSTGNLVFVEFNRSINTNSKVSFDSGIIKEFKERSLKNKTIYTIEVNGDYEFSYETAAAKTVLYISKYKTKPIFRITIDPGHGGIDPGAKGYSGTLEKDVNLRFSLILAKELEKMGYNIVLTRTNDEFIGLKERADIANSNGSKLFISIHCNAPYGKKPDVKGFEIYALSEDKIDPEAEAVAAMENEVIKYENITHDKVKEILWGFVRNEYINKSLELCAYINRNVEKITESRGIKQAGFYVLRFTQMPAVLIELG
ncbi:MAG: N-acetylmuramoyl-L-alanine amidase, partial [bacterium]|nr:N-acetylmuramoyl-L-alanine amidase [bacterium]